MFRQYDYTQSVFVAQSCVDPPLAHTLVGTYWYQYRKICSLPPPVNGAPSKDFCLASILLLKVTLERIGRGLAGGFWAPAAYK